MYEPEINNYPPAIDTSAWTTGSLSALPEDTESVRMLLVEDNEEDVFLTMRAFRAAAPHVAIDAVTCGKEGIEKAGQSRYDLAVVDSQLPDLNGIEVLDKIAAQGLPVIIVTGKGNEKLAVQALKSGAADYLVKDDGYLLRLPQAALGAVAKSRLSTENRRLIAEKARQASLLEAVLNTDPAAVVVLRGPDHIFELANSSFRALVPNLDEWDPAGLPVDQIFPNHGTPHLRKALDEVYAGGKPFSFQDVPIEDGRRYFHIHMTPLNTEGEGEERGVAVIMWETTEEVLARKRVEDMARQAEAERAWLQAVIDQMPEGVTIASAENAGIMLMNRAAVEMFGEPVDAASNADISRVYGVSRPDGTEIALEDSPLVRAMKGEVTVGEEERTKRSDGKTIDLLVNAAPLYNNEGKLTAGVVVFQDITRLKDVERLKDEFMSIASHELRTPLTNMKAAAQLMLRRTREGSYPPQEIGLINNIVQQSERMARLIEELLDVSRLQSGRMYLQAERFDLAVLVHEVVEDSRMSNPQIELGLEVGDEMRVNADRDRIAQVLSNLLENAVKYRTPTGKAEVRIRVLNVGGAARIEVLDKGIGFDPVEGERIFERFSRLGNVANHSQGMGLGLFIARQIIIAHGGTISAHSPGPGQGSAFKVTLPLDDGQ